MTETVKVDDLIIEEPVALPMSKDEVIVMINETLEDKNWSVNDLADGREVEVFPEWKTFIEAITWDYRWAGWEVFHYLHGEREFLSFTNPRKRRFNGR